MTTTCTPSASLSRQVTAGCDENAYKCYQCKKCTSGCPVARYADMHPAMIMRAVQLGQYDMIFDDRFIWLCTGLRDLHHPVPAGHRHRDHHGRAQDHGPQAGPHPRRHAVGADAQAQLRLVRALGPHVGGRAHHARRPQAAEQRQELAHARPQDDAQGQDQPHAQARRHAGHEAHGPDRREHHQGP